MAIIGRGAFGEVRLCRSNAGEIVAIKKMSKQEMIEKNQVLKPTIILKILIINNKLNNMFYKTKRQFTSEQKEIFYQKLITIGLWI